MTQCYTQLYEAKKRALANLTYAHDQIQIQILSNQKLMLNKPEAGSYAVKYLNFLAQISTRLGQLKSNIDKLLNDRKDTSEASRKIEDKLQKVVKDIESLTKKATGKRQQDIESQIRIQEQQKLNIEKELQLKFQQMQVIEGQSIQILDQFFGTFNAGGIDINNNTAQSMDLLNFQSQNQYQNQVESNNYSQNYQQPQYNNYQSAQPAYSQEAALNQFEHQTSQKAYATAAVTYEEQLAAEWAKQQNSGQQSAGSAW